MDISTIITFQKFPFQTKAAYRAYTNKTEFNLI